MVRCRFALPVLAVLAALAAAGCRERTEVLRAERIVLDGHAYDAALRPVGPARLDLQAEVVRRSPPGGEPRLHPRGTGTL